MADENVYYCEAHPETIYTSGEAPIACPKCGGARRPSLGRSGYYCYTGMCQ